MDAEIVGRTATDTRVEITAKPNEAGGSKLRIRVGVFGHEPVSRRIYDAMKKHL